MTAPTGAGGRDAGRQGAGAVVGALGRPRMDEHR